MAVVGQVDCAESVEAVAVERDIHLVSAAADILGEQSVGRVNYPAIVSAVDRHADEGAVIIRCGDAESAVCLDLKVIGYVAAVERQTLGFELIECELVGQGGDDLAPACHTHAEIAEKIAPLGVGAPAERIDYLKDILTRLYVGQRNGLDIPVGVPTRYIICDFFAVKGDSGGFCVLKRQLGAAEVDLTANREAQAQSVLGGGPRG